MTTKQKLSNLTAATSVASSDLLYVVQSGTSKKVTVANLLNNANVSLLTANVGNLNVTTSIIGTVANANVLVANAVIPLTSAITNLTAPPGVFIYTANVPSGKEGEIKFVVASNVGTGAQITITGNNISATQIVFSSSGETAILGFIGGQWHVFGGTAAVV